MAMLNIWRIPLLFYVSGMGVCFAIKKRNWLKLLMERTKRIFLPFIFGVLVISPIHLIIWQKYYSQEIIWQPNQGHLWFLANIFIYVIILLPLFFYLKRKEGGKVHQLLQKLFSSFTGIILVIFVFVAEAILINPEPYPLYAQTTHGYILGFLAFLFGFIFVYTGKVFCQTILKWKWPFLLTAAVLFTLRVVYFQFRAPNFLLAVESCNWIFAVFGFAYKHLNRPSRALNYLSKGAYPIYILHMIFLYLGAYFLIPLEISTELKFILIILFTGIGCFVTYELIRRVKLLRPLFGLKRIKQG